MKNLNTKVAIVTNNGSTISQHYGKSKYFEVLTIKDGLVQKRERREKPRNTFSNSFGKKITAETNLNEIRNYNLGFNNGNFFGLGQDMAEVISDCNCVITRGIGEGAYNKLKSSNIDVIVTDQKDIDEVLTNFLAGKLVFEQPTIHSERISLSF